MLGIPSFAVSLHVDFGSKRQEDKLNYLTAAKSASKIIQDFLKTRKMPKHTMLNINVPDVPMKKIKGIKTARQGFRYYSGSVVKRTDHRGKDYFWVGGQYLGFEKNAGTDCEVVDQGYVAVTPLKLDVTDMAFLRELEKTNPRKTKR